MNGVLMCCEPVLGQLGTEGAADPEPESLAGAVGGGRFSPHTSMVLDPMSSPRDEFRVWSQLLLGWAGADSAQQGSHVARGHVKQPLKSTSLAPDKLSIAFLVF